MSWLQKLLRWLTPSQETREAAVWTAMWAGGYSDAEIELEIQEMWNAR